MRADDLYIGGMQYGLSESLALREDLILMRNAAMGLDPPNMEVAVVLSHVVGLLQALIKFRWPIEFGMLTARVVTRTGARPAKYGNTALTVPSIVANIDAMEDTFAEAWNAFKDAPSIEHWEQMNDGILRLRMLLDVAKEQLMERTEGDG